jgi:Fe-Mn family superoxide dismutase
MNRKHFLKAGSLAGAATFLGTNTAFAKNLADNSIDKLVDAKAIISSRHCHTAKVF